MPSTHLRWLIWFLRFKHDPMREVITHPFFGTITLYELVSSRHWL